MEEEKKEITDVLCEKIEEKLQKIVDEGISTSNIDVLSKLVDIHLDLKNEKYWKEKVDMRRYGGRYGEYNGYGGNYGGSYGRDSYGRGRARDSMGRFKGEEIFDTMAEEYGNYRESGSYGAKNDAMKSLEYMLRLDEKFLDMLEEDAQSQEEIDMIRQHKMKMANM